jgi:predicted peptidase
VRASILTAAVVFAAGGFVISSCNEDDKRSSSHDVMKKNDMESQGEDRYTPVPENTHLVPDSATAVKLAEIIFLIRFKSHVNSRRPFTAKEHADYWYVSGTVPPMMVGGVPYLRISKHNAAVLSIGHSR